MDAMYKAADWQESIDTGKSLNLLDLQLYSRNEQEQRAPILAKNLMHGNQWLEDGFLPYMNIAESGQSGMRAQQQHGKMLSLFDCVYKDISKQM